MIGLLIVFDDDIGDDGGVGDDAHQKLQKAVELMGDRRRQAF